MGHSSLLGAEYAAEEPKGRDTASLGPGDSSDTGSDMMGIEDGDGADPGAPVDVALRDDQPHALLLGDALWGSASDAAGTGERRSAGNDAGRREAADIGVDRVFTPGRSATLDDAPDAGDDPDADLASVDEAAASDPVEDEDEDAIENEGDDQQADPHGLEDEDDGIPKGRS